MPSGSVASSCRPDDERAISGRMTTRGGLTWSITTDKGMMTSVGSGPIGTITFVEGGDWVGSLKACTYLS